ncbi:MAG: CDP-4-dehydro-6-deoxyglucose reductase [Chitinophagales bacterium]|jgi:CDP-4-dehydro-6-deoxyglucose reductase
MVMISTSNGLSFAQVDRESILVSSEKAGFSFPYSCRNGRCSSCKCRVLEGDTESFGEELGLSPYQKSSGWILGCVRSAKSDITLEVEDLGKVDLFRNRTLPCKIDDITLLAQDVIRIVLRFPPTSKIEYYPGQYVDVIGTGGTRRSYSIANAFDISNRLELHIKKVLDGTMSEYWFSRAKKGDLLRVNGALGTFFLRDVAGRNLVFLATGTGIAPVKAMLEGLSERPKCEQPESVAVYWGGRIASDLYYNFPEFDFDLHFEPVLSRPSPHWLGKVGYVQNAYLSEGPDLSYTEVYACGSDAMIRSARELVVGSGLPERSFYSDAFVSSMPVEKIRGSI